MMMIGMENLGWNHKIPSGIVRLSHGMALKVKVTTDVFTRIAKHQTSGPARLPGARPSITIRVFMHALTKNLLQTRLFG